MLSTPLDNPEGRLNNSEVPLKVAVKLCGRSEKTLRRKIESGELLSRQEPLDFGGFVWMVDLASLASLYPDADAVREYRGEDAVPPPSTFVHPPGQNEPVPFVRDLSKPYGVTDASAVPPPSTPGEYAGGGDSTADVPPSFQRQNDSATTVCSSDNGDVGREGQDAGGVDSTTARPVQVPDFFNYIIEENRTLKEDLRERDQRLTRIQERNGELESELGEQRGTARTQARVLEWFCDRYGPPALPAMGETTGHLPRKEVSQTGEGPRPPQGSNRVQLFWVFVVGLALGTSGLKLYWAFCRF